MDMSDCLGRGGGGGTPPPSALDRASYVQLLFVGHSWFREVLASTLILNVPERVDWKNCVGSKEEETSTALSMRTEFQPFDFTDDD